MLPRDRRRSLANEWHHFILSNYADVVSKQAAGTVIHDEFLNYRHCSVPLTEFFVIDATTTEAAIIALQDGEQTCVLNFASYCNPGGGFLNGTMAQEEALCRSSTLYEVLTEQEDKFYNSNVSTSQNKYSDEIMRIVRQRLGLNAFDTSKDSLINEMDKGEIFDHVCKWEGFVGYSDTIKGWVLDIYGVDLDDYDS